MRNFIHHSDLAACLASRMPVELCLRNTLTMRVRPIQQLSLL